MPTSWKHSREANLWHRLDPAQATRIVTDCYGEGAGAEVLLRAFLAERNTNPPAVRFWLKIYEALGKSPSSQAEIIKFSQLDGSISLVLRSSKDFMTRPATRSRRFPPARRASRSRS